MRRICQIKFALLACCLLATLSGCSVLTGNTPASSDKLVPLNPRDWPTQARPSATPVPSPFPRITLAPAAVRASPATPTAGVTTDPGSATTPAAGDPKAAGMNGQVTQGPANLRAGPGTTYPVLGSLSTGGKFTALAANPGRDWLFVEAGGQRGWLAARLVTVSGDVLALPQATPTPVQN
jgi:uncharacterized protein YgiM (DUF1202 family)